MEQQPQQQDSSSSSSSSSSSEEEEEENNTKNITNEIFSIAIPALLGLSIDPIMTLVDTAFIGKTSINADALAGVGSASGLLTFSFYIFNFLTNVTTPLVSQRRASGNEKEAMAIGGQPLSLAIIIGISLTILLMTFVHPLLNIMGVDNLSNDASQYATTFVLIRSLAAPAIFISSASTGILRGYLDSKSAFFILFATNIVNFILDVLLISIGGMGPKGAAIATTTAEWLTAFCFLGILAGVFPSADGKMGSNQPQRNIQPQDIDTNTVIEIDTDTDTDTDTQPLLLSSSSSAQQQQETISFVRVVPSSEIPSWMSVKPLIIASSSSFVRSFLLQLSVAGAAAMAARSGNNVAEVAAASIAAHQIALQLWLLCSFVCDALAAASQALVSDAIGRNDPDGVRKVCSIVFLYSVGLGIVLGLFLLLGNLSGFLLSFFTNDIPTQEALKPILYIVTASQPLNAYVFAADGVLQGASLFTYEAKSMLLSTSVAAGCFVILEHFGSDTLSHVWYGLVLLMFMRGLTATWKMIDVKGPINLLSFTDTD
jgi:Na+-driven multidrug efflux pump